MQFLNLPAFWLAVLAVPILLLYMLKLRRRQVPVSSTLLWMRLMRDQQANTPWQRLRRNLLLILQLIILATLVLALGRPALKTNAIASGSVVVLLDASASMQASDSSGTRFEQARRTVELLIDGLAGDASMTLILAGQTPQTLITAQGDKTRLKNALAQAQPTQGSSDWRAAFSLAAGVARGSPVEPTTVIISDGGLPESGLPALPGDVRYVPVGTSGDNVGITALALRRALKGPELFAEVTNFSDADRVVQISYYLDSELFEAGRLTLPAGQTQGMTMENLPDTSGIYQVRLSSPAPNNPPLDALSLDDTAFAVYQPGSDRRVLLLSEGNLFLEQVLASIPGIRPFRALPAQDGTLQIPEDSFDLYVFDGLTPPDLPGANLLLIDVPSNPLFAAGQAFREMGAVQVHGHALTRFVDWSNVHILQARQVQPPGWADVLIEARPGPLVFAGEIDGRRVAALTFDLRESDLPLQVAFPILFTNLLNYLAPPSAFDASRSLHVGESLDILAEPGVERVVVVTPSNQIYNMPAVEGALTFTRTDELGYYAVNFLRGDGQSVEYFTVNLFDPAESDIRPRESIQVGRTTVTPVLSQQIGLREVWPPLALAALIVLLIEWQAYHRRPLPRPRVLQTPGR